MNDDQKMKGNAVKAIAASDRFTGRIRRFMVETIAELRRCTWPSRSELFESTILVIVVMGVLALFVAGVDELARIAIKIITTGKF